MSVRGKHSEIGRQMPGKDIQRSIHRELQKVLDAEDIVLEWSIRREAEDTFANGVAYAPRLDIAVGPFNLTRENHFADAETIQNTDHRLIRKIRTVVREQNGTPFENPNPRCLLAIEVEYATSSKHILGAITNASMLGLYGVIIGPNAYIAKILRIQAYVVKLKEVGKARRDLFANVACFEHKEFVQLIRESATVRRPVGR